MNLFFEVTGLLRPGVTVAQANAELAAASSEYHRKFPNTDWRGQFTVGPLRDNIIGDARNSLLIMLGAVGLVLLISCANVTNLLLVRATVRKREFAIRSALGAGRARIVRQLLTESVLLSLAGGILGMALGFVGVRALLAISPAGLPRIGEDGSAISMDWRVLGFTLTVSLLTGILFGLSPAFSASRSDSNSTLKESGNRSGTGFREGKTRSLLVVSEISLALVLLTQRFLFAPSSPSRLSANPAIPMVKQLTALVAKQNQDAARFVHWGATSQDVNDTGLVLQIREAWGILESDLPALCTTLAVMAQQYRSTVILGRTLMQHAQPTTFGAKVAAWLDAMHRHRVRFRKIGNRVFVLQFGGAVGTLAALKEKGFDVSEALAQELRLELPDIPWHTQRDRLAEVATTLGLCTGTLGKLARDISVHMQPEIAELFEPAGERRGGSSSMPHKRTPVSAARILAAAIRVPAPVSTMLIAMVQEDERGLGNWHSEWETLPEIVRLTAGALHEMKETMPRLEVDVKKMRSNLDQTNGLVFAEAVSMALAESMGKSGAHGVVEAASQRVRTSGKTLRKELQQDPSVTQVLSTEVLDQLFIPEKYLGSAEAFVDRVVASTKQL